MDLGKMMLGLNLVREDYACKCGCGQDTVDSELAYVLWRMDFHFGKKHHVTSGNRCKKDNDRVRGSKDSQHMEGRAADVWYDGIEPDEVWAYLKESYPGKFGIGRYNTFTHIDTKSGPARRWDTT
jgi:uncharacterized protein YcbK (DUF882 family)